MKTIGVLALTFGAGASTLWVFSQFGTVTMSYELVAGMVTIGASFVAFIVGAVAAGADE